MKSFIENILSELDEIRDLTIQLLDISRIQTHRDNNYNSPVRFIMINPNYFVDIVDGAQEQKRLQHLIIPKFEKWYNKFALITKNLTKKEKQTIEKVYNFIESWIERKNPQSLPDSIPKAKDLFQSKLTVYYDILQYLKGNGEKKIILIPDTNALIMQPEPQNYSSVAEQENYTFLITPTITRELDDLKVRHQNPEFREKAKSIIKRLKGYRVQGKMTEGVIVHSSITVKMIANEPDFDNTLTILDKDNLDDRLIASAIEVQIDNLDSIIYIITADINLQNKCEMVNFPYAEVPGLE